MASFNPKILKGYNNVTKSINTPTFYTETVTGTTDVEGSYDIGEQLRGKGYDVNNKLFMLLGYSCNYIIGVGQRMNGEDKIINLHFTGDVEGTPTIQEETITPTIIFTLI